MFFSLSPSSEKSLFNILLNTCYFPLNIKVQRRWNTELFNFVSLEADVPFTASVHIFGLSPCNWRKNEMSLAFCSVCCGESDEDVTLKMHVLHTFFGLCLRHLWQIRTEPMLPEVDLSILKENISITSQCLPPPQKRSTCHMLVGWEIKVGPNKFQGLKNFPKRKIPSKPQISLS